MKRELGEAEVYWYPEYDGHEPPFFMEGTWVDYYDRHGGYHSNEKEKRYHHSGYGWKTGYTYIVPKEMVDGFDSAEYDVPEGFYLWEPKYNGNRPPFYQDKEVVSYLDDHGHYNPADSCSGNYSWLVGYKYVVPKRMVDGLDSAEFDVSVWLRQGLANLDKLPEGTKLPEPFDWAGDLVRKIVIAVDNHGYGAGADLLRENVIWKPDAE